MDQTTDNLSDTSEDKSVVDPYENSEDDDPDFDPQKQKCKKLKVIPDYFGLRGESGKETIEKSKDISKNNKNQCSDALDESIMEKIKNNPLLDGKFFEIVGKVTSNTNHIQAECKLCLPKKTLIKGSLNISTNFIKHIRTKHKEQLASYSAYKLEKKKDRKEHILFKDTFFLSRSSGSETSNSATTSSFLEKPKTSLKQGQILFRQAKITQKTFDERIVRFIIESMSPVSIISHESFIKIFEGMDVKVMDRFAAVKKIDNLYSDMIQKIGEQLSNCQFVCTTADIWSSKKRSFLGVTCHWVDENLTRHSVALACRRFEGTHSFDRVGELLDDIYRSFNLDCKKILATVTDNGSNFVKCFKEFGISYDDSLRHFDELEELKTDGDEQDEPEFVTLEETLNPEGSTHKKILPEHLRCASHTINLIATTDYNNSLKTSHQLRSKNCLVSNKCSYLWNKARRPKSAEIIQQTLGCTLSYPGVTRWNSTYDAVQKILSIKEKLLELCEKLNIPKFTENDISFLGEYCLIMKPLAETLDFLQGEQNTYYGYLLPSIVSMFIKLEKIKLSQNTKQLAKPLEHILESIQKRFHNLFLLESKPAVIAAVVNPRFKLRWLNAFKDTTNQISAKDIQSWVISAASSFQESTELELTVPENEDTFFDFRDDIETTLSTSVEQPLSNVTFQNQFEFELLKYLNDKRTALTMLNDYSIVKKLFIKYNTILPSSAPVERLFSFAQIINAPRRHALSDTNFEKLVLLKSNKDIY